MFTVKYDTKVFDDIKRLPKSLKSRIKQAIEKKLTIEPQLYGKPLRNSLLGFRSLRVGVYRIIFLLEKKNVMIMMIDHRKNVYDKFIKRIGK